MAANFYWYFIVALVPLLVGAVYYHPAVAGKAWMDANGFTKERLEGGNMMRIFLFSYLLGCLLAFMMQFLVIHQIHLFNLMMPEVLESAEAQAEFNSIVERYDRYRDFKHGALHGLLVSIFFAWPILGINAMFERRGWKYTGIHLLYWAITLTLMGGLICQFLEFPKMG